MSSVGLSLLEPEETSVCPHSDGRPVHGTLVFPSPEMSPLRVWLRSALPHHRVSGSSCLFEGVCPARSLTPVYTELFHRGTRPRGHSPHRDPAFSATETCSPLISVLPQSQRPLGIHTHTHLSHTHTHLSDTHETVTHIDTCHKDIQTHRVTHTPVTHTHTFTHTHTLLSHTHTCQMTHVTHTCDTHTCHTHNNTSLTHIKNTHTCHTETCSLTHTCIHTHELKHTHADIHTQTHTDTHTYTHSCTCSHTQTCIHIHTQTWTQTHSHTHIHTHIQSRISSHTAHGLTELCIPNRPEY